VPVKEMNAVEIINNFKGKKIGVIGDLMLDHFIWGNAERLSPEAPVPVVLAKKECFIPGGAGNVATNIVALGGKAFVLGLAGKDNAAEILIQEFKKNNIDTAGVIRIEGRLTTQKIRIIAGNQQVARVDRENCDYIDSQTEESIIKFVFSQIEKWDAIVISDYAKGLITENLSKKIIDLANKSKKSIICDAKPKHFRYFENITLLKPNYKEAVEMAGTDDVNKAGKFLQGQLKSDILITQGSQGMTLFRKDKITHFPTQAKEIFDVAGAGDTVVAGLALCLAGGATMEDASFISNLAAGIVVGKLGVATVSKEELINALKNV
jgi:D-glycero-beta-D-manno-heptose-7-phosphate kinase